MHLGHYPPIGVFLPMWVDKTVKQSEPSENCGEPRCAIDTWGAHFALLITATATSRIIRPWRSCGLSSQLPSNQARAALRRPVHQADGDSYEYPFD
jgi:hypothetical protein